MVQRPAAKYQVKALRLQRKVLSIANDALEIDAGTLHQGFRPAQTDVIVRRYVEGDHAAAQQCKLFCRPSPAGAQIEDSLFAGQIEPGQSLVEASGDADPGLLGMVRGFQINGIFHRLVNALSLVHGDPAIGLSGLG